MQKYETYDWSQQQTTDSYATLPRDWTKLMGIHATILVSNVGDHPADVQVLGSLNGVDYPLNLRYSNAPIAAGAHDTVVLDSYVPHVRIRVKSANSGQATTIKAQAAAVSG